MYTFISHTGRKATERVFPLAAAPRVFLSLRKETEYTLTKFIILTLLKEERQVSFFIRNRLSKSLRIQWPSCRRIRSLCTCRPRKCRSSAPTTTPWTAKFHEIVSNVKLANTPLFNLQINLPLWEKKRNLS